MCPRGLDPVLEALRGQRAVALASPQVLGLGLGLEIVLGHNVNCNKFYLLLTVRAQN